MPKLIFLFHKFLKIMFSKFVIEFFFIISYNDNELLKKEILNIF